MTAKAAAKAKALYTAVLACDSQTLTRLATGDKTSLSFGATTPQQAFALPGDKERYAALATLLSMTPVPDIDGTLTPKVFSERYGDDEAAWAEVVRVGLVTQAQARLMRLDNGQYVGYRLGIASDGTWTYLIAGD